MVVLHSDPVPLHVDETGTIRIGPTRVTLDVFIADYNKGWSPEKIVHELDTLNLADVYGVISYYLRHRDELDEYLRQRRVQADELQRKIEAEQPQRRLGTMKGTVRYMAPDFNAPLDDFKEYME